MADCNYFHVGILVKDLDRAIEDFSRVLQVEFNPPSVLMAPMVWHGQRIERDMRVTYSKTAPYIELMEAHPDGYFSIEQGEGFHHMGVWGPDFDSPEWKERFQELILEAHLPGDDPKTAAALSDPASCHGVRIEIIHQSKKPAITQWAEGALAKPL